MVAIVYVAIFFINTKFGKFNRLAFGLYFFSGLSYMLIGATYPSVDENFRLNLGPLFYVLLLSALCGPFLLMLISKSLFGENPSIPKWAVILISLQLVLDGTNFWRSFGDCAWPSKCIPPVQTLDPYDLPAMILTLTPSLIAIGFFGLAVFYTLKDWRTDLVEQRRQFRRGFTILLGILGIGIVLIEDFSLNFYPSIFPSVVDIDSILIAVFYAAVSLVSLRSDPREFLKELVAQQTHVLPIPLQSPTARQNSSPDLTHLLALMNEAVYRQPGLNVAKLSEKLALPEYRLRKLINGELGFRNFNSFLNHHRIIDACRQLADQSKRETTILDIALDVGFGSITSFNDAFKKQLDTTPTAYRKAKMNLPS